MNPIIQKLGVFAAMLSAFLSASAYDFEVGGIFYNIINSTAKEVEVTYEDIIASSYSGDVVVPSSVSYNGEQYTVAAIGESAFSSCLYLTSITIPNSVTAIGESAFSYSSLTSITIPNSVTTIGEAAFGICSSLTSIAVDGDNQKYSSIDGILYDKSQTSLICYPGGKTGDVIISNTVTTIGDSAFAGCVNLTSITLPNTVTTIGVSAFEHCISLTSITLPNAVTTIGFSVFFDCQSLTSITLPNTVTTIGEGAFNCCTSLTTITLPNTLTTIGDYAFGGCGSLASITLPNTLTTIGEVAFIGCTSLTSITSLAVTPPNCGGYAFGGVDIQKCTLYVPAESIEAYKQAPEWKDFILVKETSGIDLIVADPSADVEVFKLNGTRVSGPVGNLPAGIYIVREGSTARKIIVR